MKIEVLDGIVVLRMQAGKANAMSISFLESLDGLLTTLETQHKEAKCIVFTGYEKFFSAGLNLLELWDYDEAQLKAFFHLFSTVFLRWVKLPQLVIAAINGNAIAGGAILAQTADYRIMAQGDFKIGVNEVNLGIPFPKQVLDIVKQRVPATSYFEVFYQGRLYNPEAALKIGFIDEVCSADQLETRALSLAQELNQKSRAALQCVKRDLAVIDIARQELLAKDGDQEFLDIWFSPETRATLGAMVEALKAKKR